MTTPKYRARPRVLLTTLADETGVLLDLDTKFYFTMNAASVAVWQLLESRGPTELDALAGGLVAHFDVELDRARTDCETLLRDLEAEGLVDRV